MRDPTLQPISDLTTPAHWLVAWSEAQVLSEKTPVSPAVYLAWLATMLETAPRLGSRHDAPEGLRVLQMSDTLARQIAARLRTICEVL